MTLRQLKQTASKDMPDYKQTLRPSGCVPARLSLESDARFSASGARQSFRAALPSLISCYQATQPISSSRLRGTLQVLPHRGFGANPIPGFLKSLLSWSRLILSNQGLRVGDARHSFVQT
jgi:hypothetical protein